MSYQLKLKHLIAGSGLTALVVLSRLLAQAQDIAFQLVQTNWSIERFRPLKKPLSLIPKHLEQIGPIFKSNSRRNRSHRRCNHNHWG